MPAILAAAIAPAPPADTAAVRATVDALLAGVAAKDAPAILALVRPEGNATVVVERSGAPGVVRHLTWAEFTAGLKPGPPRFEPRLLPGVSVRVDGDLAMAWTPYAFRVDGRLDHCGVNHFDLVRDAGAWKILNVTYTYRTEGCGA